MQYRAFLSVVLFFLALAPFVIGKNGGQGVPGTSGRQGIVIRNSTSFIVPTLVALGWDDFFLNRRSEIGLSPRQAQELLSLYLGFVVATQEVEKSIKEAERALYEELDRDQVAAREVEWNARWVLALRGELTVLRFRYLLRAARVLSQEQRQKLMAPARLREALPAGRDPDPPTLGPRRRLPELLPAPMLQAIQYREYLPAEWRRAEADPCRSQATVSVQALLAYPEGREAAKRLMKLADQLQKRAGSEAPVDNRDARKLVGQMRPEFSLVEWTAQALVSLVGQNRDQQFAQLAARLQTQPMADELTRTIQEVNRNVVNAAILAREAKQVKQLARDWRQGVEQASEVLCLEPPVGVFAGLEK